MLAFVEDLMPATFIADGTQKLIQNCKQHQVTVNIVLCTAILAVHLEQRGHSAMNTQLAIPGNIRERYAVKAEKTFSFFCFREFCQIQVQ